MHEIDSRLKELERNGRPIRVGLVGAGQMGTEIITQIGEMVGMEVAVVVDLKKELAMAGYGYSKKKREIVFTNDLQEAQKESDKGKCIASTNYKIATGLSAVDAVVDATGSIEMGAIISLDAIDQKKHIVMMNVECDVTIGPILRKLAENAGIVYSLAAGDEPAAIIELYRFAKSLGFTVVTAGKGKNNPLNIYATPDTEKEKAQQRKMSAKMLCEFVDGSKTAVEMASVSNATGLLPDVRGMHGAKASVETLKDVFIPKKEGGVLESSGVVDFAIGVHPGVFLIVTTENERIKEGLVQRDMGDGPYYLLFRPYHLCSIEVPLTIAQAVLYNESSGHPMKEMHSECIGVAKKALKTGEVLDGIGEYCYRTSIEKSDIAKKEGLVPVGLLKKGRLKTDIEKDSIITFQDVELDTSTILYHLRMMQDKLDK